MQTGPVNKAKCKLNNGCVITIVWTAHTHVHLARSGFPSSEIAAEVLEGKVNKNKVINSIFK